MYRFKKKQKQSVKMFNILISKNVLVFLALFELSDKSLLLSTKTSAAFVLLAINILLFSCFSNIKSSVNDESFGFTFFIILPIVLILKLFTFTTNILVFLILLELINYIFYFQFLGVSTKTAKSNKNRQFDAILIYFWSTFISLVVIVI